MQGTLVDAAYVADLLDFIDEWDFELTPKAMQRIGEAQSMTPYELLQLKVAPPELDQECHSRLTAEDQGEVTIPAHLRFEN